MPFLITNGHEPTRERLQSPRTGSASTTPPSASCAPRAPPLPGVLDDGQYFGPAAIVNAHRFIFDSRDEGGEQRLEILNDSEGVWRCRTTFNCTEACPRGIEVTKAIQEVKRALSRAASEVACQRPRRFRRGATVGLDGPSAAPVRALALSLLLGATGAVVVPAAAAQATSRPRRRVRAGDRSRGRVAAGTGAGRRGAAGTARGSSSTWHPGCRRRRPFPPVLGARRHDVRHDRGGPRPARAAPAGEHAEDPHRAHAHPHGRPPTAASSPRTPTSGRTGPAWGCWPARPTPPGSCSRAC